MSFTGKVVLIIEASSGIGAATAIHLAELGASLSITGSNKQNLDKIAERCGQSKTFIITGELTNENDLKNIINSTIEHYFKLDVLVINGGIPKSMELFLEHDKINIDLLYQLMNLAVPHLIKTKGNIVNVSLVTKSFYSNCLEACMNKSEINQLTRCCALNLLDQVRVNAVNPGFVITKLDESSGKSDEEYVKLFNNVFRDMNVCGRAGDVSEVAKTIAFLASDDASFITGAILPVDGGRRVKCPH